MRGALKRLAEETLAIQDGGGYDYEGRRVDIGSAQQAAVSGTTLLRPDELEGLVTRGRPRASFDGAKVTVTREKTQEAARRLVEGEGATDVVLLNFASARHVGGGFLTGARAQEEDVVRSSGLFRCLETQPEYYEANRHHRSLLYTDHIIYSPGVPFFRAADPELLPEPFLASVITAPAPNAGEHLRAVPHGHDELREALRRRVSYVLATAEAFHHSTLILGAWGCGVFRNDPEEVSDEFLTALASPRFERSFSRVDFAVFDPSPELSTFRAFEARASRRTG
jgi:uncharacterized protein (TIGR02452 family)